MIHEDRTVKVLLAALLVCVPLLGCGDSLWRPYRVAPEYPTVNLPVGLRQQNWLGPKRSGSCVYASTVMLLRWQGRYDLAEQVQQIGDGSWSERLGRDLTVRGIRFAETTNGSVRFLEWACATRRGAGVTWGYDQPGGHMLCLVHLDEQRAGILDNNYPDKITWLERDEFIAWWKKSGGWAVSVVVGPPAAPLPQ